METVATTINNLSAFLDFFAKATPWILVVGAWLTYYYREKVKQILAKSLSIDVEKLRADLAKDHASYAANLQRDIEAYKVSLISETERHKAVQDVRKSIALKVAERRFSAIAALMDCHLGLDTSIASLGTLAQNNNAAAEEHYATLRKEMHERLYLYTKASDAAIVFVESDVRTSVLKVRRLAWDVMNKRKLLGQPALADDDPDVAALLDASTALDGSLRTLLGEYELMPAAEAGAG